MPGPPKKEGAIRRNKPPKPTVLESNDATPSDRPLAGEWSAGTMRWWATWVGSPQATQFAETDWQRLEMLARIVEQYLAKPDKALLAEIRMNEERLGATVADRKRLNWELPPKDAPQARPVDGRRAHIRIVDHQVTG